MQSSTTNEVQCWPPTQEITEDNVSIKSCDLVLPEALYWDFIRPFTPVKDRAIINKRTGSTQFYAGDRIPLDRDYLLRFGESGKFHGGKRARMPFQPSDCETFEITLPPEGECEGICFGYSEDAGYHQEISLPVFAPFHNDAVASQIPIRHQDANSWIVQIGDKSLVGAAIRKTSPAQAAYKALEACQTDGSNTISITLCSMQGACRKMPATFEHLPYTEGEPGSSDFRLSFENQACVDEITDPDEVLVMLQKVRDNWDKHMSLIPCPTQRLHACLDLFRWNHSTCSGNYWDKERCRLLFPGDGSIEDLATFHASMNKLSVKGPPISRALPNTQLGYWGGIYLSVYSVAKVQKKSLNESIVLGHIFRTLAETGADVEEFYEPMDIYPEDAIVRGDSIVSNDMISVLCALRGSEENFGSGMAVMECMKCYFNVHHESDINSNLRGLVGLVSCLDEHKKDDFAALRFSVGDRVECFMNGEWLPGTILEQWYTDDIGFKHPYHIDLDDEDDQITAPFDSESVVRRPMPELRFNVGDNVVCLVRPSCIDDTVWSRLLTVRY